MKNPKLFSFRRLALPVVAAMLVALWPVLPAAAADGGPTQIHVDKPTAIAVDSTTNQIYVVSADDNTLTTIDGATDTVSRVISIGSDPRSVAVNPATGKIYVACYGGGLVVLDEGGGLMSTLDVGADPLAVAVDQAANKIYVINDGSSNITVVDGATGSMSTINASLTEPREVAVNDATGKVYVVAGINVYAIDPKSNTTVTAATGTLPRGIAVDPDTGRAYVADWGGNGLLEISSTGSSLFSTGKQPIDVAVNPATGQVYVADSGSSDLTVLSAATQVTSIGLAAAPTAVGVNPTTNQVYVLSQNGNSVTVINGSAASSPSGANPPASPGAPAPAQQTVIVFDIGQTAYTVNGAVYQMDAAPVISEGRTLLPVSAVATALGASVAWNSSDQEATISLNGKTLDLWIGKGTAMVNGVSTPIDPDNPNVTPILAPPGRTMLPLRFISENLGCQVNWNSTLQEATLTYPES